jgi:hypothetical protein
MPSPDERTAIYDEHHLGGSQQRLLYWIGPDQQRSTEVRSKSEAEKLIGRSGIKQALTFGEFRTGRLTASYSEGQKRLFYWVTSDEGRSKEVSDIAEVQELIEDSGVPQVVEDDEFRVGDLYIFKKIEGRTPATRANIMGNPLTDGPFEVEVVTTRVIRGPRGEREVHDRDNVGSFDTFDEARVRAENSLGSRITAEEFSTSLKQLGIRQKWLAGRLGVATSTVNRWATGALPVAPYVPFVLELLQERREIRDRLSSGTPVRQNRGSAGRLRVVG